MSGLGDRAVPLSGGGAFASVDATSNPVDLASAAGFIVVASAAAWVGGMDKVGSLSGAQTLTIANATPIAANIPYVFDRGGSGRYAHVAGRGGAATITVTAIT